MNKSEIRRLKRVRSKVKKYNHGNRPIIYINISNKNISAQLIDSYSANVLVYISSIGDKKIKGTGIEISKKIGGLFAKKCIDKKIKDVVFDKGSKSYIGRVKSFADSCRESGLNF